MICLLVLSGIFITIHNYHHIFIRLIYCLIEKDFWFRLFFLKISKFIRSLMALFLARLFDWIICWIGLAFKLRKLIWFLPSFAAFSILNWWFKFSRFTFQIMFWKNLVNILIKISFIAKSLTQFVRTVIWFFLRYILYILNWELLFPISWIILFINLFNLVFILLV